MNFLADMRDLFELRLRKYHAQVLWRAYGWACSRISPAALAPPSTQAVMLLFGHTAK